jgi:putative oxidoreductase
MLALARTVQKWYAGEIRVLDYVKDPFLLILRLYFGWRFVIAGTGKLQNIQTTTGLFADWGIPAPQLNVYLAGTTETVCGILLVLGAGSRLITIPLIGTMVVAYMTAHSDQWAAFWTNTSQFFKAPAFPYLFTALVVLLFGPGRLSVDALLGRCCSVDAPGSESASPSPPGQP